MQRIIMHWTAGRYKASALDRQHYHYIFEDDGREVPGKFPISANAGPLRKGAYAAHTLNCNTGSIGLSMACMVGAEEGKTNGVCPMTETQFEAMCAAAAKLCTMYNIPVSTVTTLSHAEVQGNLNIKQRGKWDFSVLPFKPELKGARECGDYARERIKHYLDVKTPTPVGKTVIVNKPVPIMADPGELEKHPAKSKTVWTWLITAVITPVMAVVSDWRVQMFIIAIIAAFAIYGIKRRFDLFSDVKKVIEDNK